MIFIDELFCKGCGICVHYCPQHVLEISNRVNRRGYYIPRVIDEEECTYCRTCDLFCPDFAIFVEEEEGKKKKKKDRKKKEGGVKKGE